MKNYFFCGIAAVCALGLISWGYTGHRAIAKIAEAHLTDKTQQAVKNLLNNETLVDVSNYADEIRSNPEYKSTGPWHYVDLPVGLSYDQFSNTVKTMHDDNVYKAILQFERDLKNQNKSKGQKATALKFLVHFIADAHQPMHVSRAEDRGGNSIMVKFAGNEENLHSLWDNGLIEHTKLHYKQMAAEYDKATPAEIKKWQHDDLMVWLWESYQISTILYQEAAQNPNFDEAYYQSHLPILEKRIEKAGIRLAGVLNAIFDSPYDLGK